MTSQDQKTLAKIRNDRNADSIADMMEVMRMVFDGDVVHIDDRPWAGRADLVDLVEVAMGSVHDMDVTFHDYAEAIADAIINAEVKA